MYFFLFVNKMGRKTTFLELNHGSVGYIFDTELADRRRFKPNLHPLLFISFLYFIIVLFYFFHQFSAWAELNNK